MFKDNTVQVCYSTLVFLDLGDYLISMIDMAGLDEKEFCKTCIAQAYNQHAGNHRETFIEYCSNRFTFIDNIVDIAMIFDVVISRIYYEIKKIFDYFNIKGTYALLRVIYVSRSMFVIEFNRMDIKHDAIF